MSKSIITAFTLFILFTLSTPVQAQFPQYFNFGGNNGTCGDFSGASTTNITSTGDIPYEPGVSVISGKNIEIFAANVPILGAGVNQCMYQNELYGKFQSDLVITFCSLPVGQDLDITLHFAELYDVIAGPGQRLFNIVIDGNLQQSNFDNWAEGNALNGGLGGNYVAVAKSYTVTVGASGCVEILLESTGIQNPRINGITLDEVGTTFPVEMLSFDATKGAEKEAVLTWSTASELNNAGFEVQYSQDGVNYTTDGFVEGVGTTLEVQQYTYKMNDLNAGKYSFRLKQIDYDGAYEYSRKVELTLQASSGRFLSTIYPNPTSDESHLFVSLKERQQLTIQVLNLSGQEVSAPIQLLMEANQSEEILIDTRTLTPGVYIVVINGAAFKEVQRLLVK